MCFNCSRIRDGVPRSRINHQLERLPRFLQFVRELQGVLHVDVVVRGSVNQQQFPMKIRGCFTTEAFAYPSGLFCGVRIYRSV